MNDIMYQTSYEELITAQRALALSCLLEEDSFSMNVGLHLPCLWHLVYFWNIKLNSELDLSFLTKSDVDILKKADISKPFYKEGTFTFVNPIKIGEPYHKGQKINFSNITNTESNLNLEVDCYIEIVGLRTTSIIESHKIIYNYNYENNEADRAGVVEQLLSNNEKLYLCKKYKLSTELITRFNFICYESNNLFFDKYSNIVEKGFPGVIINPKLLLIIIIQNTYKNQEIEKINYINYQVLFDNTIFFLKYVDRKKSHFYVICDNENIVYLSAEVFYK